MQLNKFIMMHIAVADVDKSKEFYVNGLGFTEKGDSGPGAMRWLPLEMPGGAELVLTNFHEHMKPGVLKLYFQTSDVEGTHKELSEKGLKVDALKDDLYGPGSGVKWFKVEDPDGNHIHIVQG